MSNGIRAISVVVCCCSSCAIGCAPCRVGSASCSPSIPVRRKTCRCGAGSVATNCCITIPQPKSTGFARASIGSDATPNEHLILIPKIHTSIQKQIQMAGNFVVSLTHAKNDTDKATVAFVIANAALASEKKVMVLLSIESTTLSQKGFF